MAYPSPQSSTEACPTHPRLLRPTISFSSLDPFGDIDYALLLLLQPSNPPLLFLFNTVIRGLARSCHRSKSVSSSLLVFERMGELNLSPNSFAFTFLFQVCSKIVNFDLGRLMHCVVIKNSFVNDVFVRNSMIRFYSVSSELGDARGVFDESPARDVVSWNGYLGHGDVSEALELFGKMPNRNDVSWNSLLGGFVKFGCVGDPYRLFVVMPRRNLVSWVLMISGYAQNGQPKEALELFREMQLMDQEWMPNSAILVSVLSACSHIDFAMQVFSSSGKKDVSVYTAAISGLATNGRSREALQLFEKMIVQGISPDELDHYACMVDLLGRAGMLEEAENFVASMPIMPDAVIWGALLGACRVHGNTEMGERIGNILIASDQNNDGRYILLSNIYAESMKGKDAEEVRKAMRSRKLKRIPGCSLIEVDGIVHEFFAGDRLHEKKEEIYLKWEAIVKQIKNFGYKEETRGVVFDVEEEEKETIIGYHSEKLAVAFGILCTKPGSMLRIVKNICICNDFHSAIKLVSKVFKRKISVRDRKLFHHFENGSCSCKDYGEQVMEIFLGRNSIEGKISSGRKKNLMKNDTSVHKILFQRCLEGISVRDEKQFHHFEDG
ncbi:pentatricopeptide repeat-containing protein At5g66520-like [Malania oleifera]|uniref:pentatricopeptide repeat-containing protein At5g66520-like n=1 Tax=Malania oleifera TaxID=397392 RepID=UPI0025AE44A5|nr:pentatricopeptide repeat-containing protein At5g66520-like [Malania oleifera]